MAQKNLRFAVWSDQISTASRAKVTSAKKEQEDPWINQDATAWKLGSAIPTNSGSAPTTATVPQFKMLTLRPWLLRGRGLKHPFALPSLRLRR
jgi:hypothetical protein